MFSFINKRPSLSAAAANLEKYNVSAELRARFAQHLEKSPSREAYHVNPRLLAERLNLNERETLNLLVAALYEGLVTLHWDVQCPVCGHLNHNDALYDLKHDFECAMCHAEVTPKLDNEVHVTFSVRPRFRSLYADANDKDFRMETDARLGSVSGQALLLLPEFRRLFPQERLLPDESLEVGRVALLFTDLAGSTALYAQRGDPRAYHLVRLHFDELFAAAAAHNGTVVKNIGDAVMAAFETPVQALAAALEMQSRIASLNQRRQLTGEERLILKIGLHSGPCLHVSLNERPDYFGTTVNLAARVQGLSHGNDVVFTDSIAADAEVNQLLASRTVEKETATVKGIEGNFSIYRHQL
jgi:class 3 adenylate cyclase